MYYLNWKPEVVEQLAAIWLAHPNHQNHLTKLVEQLEHLLKYVPRNQGESRYSTVRVMFLDMLIVTFDVIEDDKRVDILDIRNKPQ